MQLKRAFLTTLLLAVFHMTFMPGATAVEDDSRPPGLADPDFVEARRQIIQSKQQSLADGQAIRTIMADRDRVSTQHNYDVRFYNIAFRVDDTTETLWGCITFVADATENDVTEIQIDFIDSLGVNSIVAPTGMLSYSRDFHVTTVTLDRAYDTGEEFTLNFYYHGHPVEAYQLHGGFTFSERPLGTPPNTEWVPVMESMSEPYGARGFWPCKDRPDDKPDSIKVEMTVDSWFYATTNGRLDSIVTPIGQGNIRVYYYTEPHPITTYAFAVSMTNFMVLEDWWYYNGGQDSMPYINYVYPEELELAQEHYALGPWMLTYFSEAFGLYPYVDCKYGHYDFWIGLGMEHQTNTASLGDHDFYGDYMYEYLVIHEGAHQWWGNLITCESWGHVWLNEGWGTYAEAIYYGNRWGWDSYHQYIDENFYWYEDGSIYRRDTTDLYSIFDILVYNKGGLVCHMLRRVVGDSLFFHAIDAWFNSEFRWHSATTEDFCDVWEAATGMELSWFFDNWIYGYYQPYYRHAFWSEPAAGGGYDAFVIVDQTHTTDPQVFGMPVDFVFHTAAGPSDTLQLWCDNRRNTFVLHFDDSLESLEFDPGNWLLENNAPTSFSYQFVVEEELPVATMDVPYSFLLDLRGDYDWNSFAVTDGVLPSGFGVDSLGYLAGVTPDTGWFEFTVRADDNWGSNWDIGEFYLYVSSLSHLPGDADQSGQVDIGDLVFLAIYMFQDGPAPENMNLVDVDASCELDIGDLVYLAVYMFQDGPALKMGCIED